MGHDTGSDAGLVQDYYEFFLTQVGLNQCATVKCYLEAPILRKQVDIP